MYSSIQCFYMDLSVVATDFNGSLYFCRSNWWCKQWIQFVRYLLLPAYRILVCVSASSFLMRFHYFVNLQSRSFYFLYRIPSFMLTNALCNVRKYFIKLSHHSVVGNGESFWKRLIFGQKYKKLVQNCNECYTCISCCDFFINTYQYSLLLLILLFNLILIHFYAFSSEARIASSIVDLHFIFRCDYDKIWASLHHESSYLCGHWISTGQWQSLYRDIGRYIKWTRPRTECNGCWNDYNSG